MLHPFPRANSPSVPEYYELSPFAGKPRILSNNGLSLYRFETLQRFELSTVQSVHAGFTARPLGRQLKYNPPVPVLRNTHVGTVSRKLKSKSIKTTSKCRNISISTQHSVATSMSPKNRASMVRACLADVPQSQHPGTHRGNFWWCHPACR